MKLPLIFRRSLTVLSITLGLLIVISKIGLAKGNFARITIKSLESGQDIIVTAPVYNSFFTFSDMVDGVTQTPEGLGAGYEITRWYKAADGESYQPFDRLRWYPSTGTATQGRGWIFYEGLINGASDYDGKWFIATRNGDNLLREATIFLTDQQLATSQNNTEALNVAKSPGQSNPEPEMEVADQLSSPDGKWIAQVRWPAGENPLAIVELRIMLQDGSYSWTPIREQREMTIVEVIPRFVRWSNDSRYLYVGKELSANGCPSFGDFNGLRRIDMLTRQVTEYFDQSVTLAVSPDDRWVAYIKGEPRFDGSSQLFLLDLSTHETRLVLLNLPAEFIEMGAIVWSPASDAFVLTVTDKLCTADNPKRRIVQVTVPDLEMTTLYKTDELSVQTADWSFGEKLRLVSLEGDQYDLLLPAPPQLVKTFPPDVFVDKLRLPESAPLKGIVWEEEAHTDVAQPTPHDVPINFCTPYDVHQFVDYTCAQRIETFQFEQGIVGVTREDGRLSVETAKGRVSFVDQQGQGGGGYENYSYLGWLPGLQQHLVSVHFYEGDSYLLTNPTSGEIVQLPGIPTINEAGTRLVSVRAGGEQTTLSILLWRVDARSQSSIQPDRLIMIPYGENFTPPNDISLYWFPDDQLNLNLFYNWQHVVTHISLNVDSDDPVIHVNNDLPVRPVIRFSDFYQPLGTIRNVDTAASWKRIYNDRDYMFTSLSPELDGQPYFLFNNNNMHETAANYATFHLYQPATLYVAMDEQACGLPGWMTDWEPSDTTVFTTDIGMKLYKKAFPAGDVTLGGNEMAPAGCIRSHYLLFIGKSGG